MSEAVPNESEWAANTAALLKAVFVDFAKAPPPQRAQFIKEELSRAIKPIPNAERASYLDRLKMKFPIFAPPAPPPPPAGLDPNLTPVETASFEDLTKALRERIGAMTPDEKAKLAKQLEPLLPFPKPVAAPLPAPAPAPVAVSAPAAAADSKDREMLRAALDNFATLDAYGWRIYRQIAPQGRVRKDGDLRTEALEYLGGNAEILPRIKDTMAKSRMVIGGLLWAVGGAPIKFANDFCGIFSPDNISAEVGDDKKKCWVKYVELARQDFPIASALSFKIHKRMAEFAEDMMKQP